jgi:branched-chain amino acid transport system permease protein
LRSGLVAPFAVYPTFLMKALCFGLFASAFNLLLGYVGLLSFGHAAFLGVAGYVCGMMVRDAGVTPELGIVAGTAAAACSGLGFRQVGNPPHRHLLSR